MRRRIIWLLLIFLALAAAYRLLRPRPQSLPVAYIGEGDATLWSSAAQVREPVGVLRFGEQVAVVERLDEQVEVRTAKGATGWIEAKSLLEPSVWQQSLTLLERTRSAPVQATGETKVPSNVRVEPGRTAARICQFPRGVPVQILGRTVAEMTPTAEERSGVTKEGSAEVQKVRREDWFLVRGKVPFGAENTEAATPGAQGPSEAEGNVAIAGWILARFIELALPQTIRDYTSSSGMRVLAWFELNRVADPSGEKPQYLVAGVRGGEGQPCDFTLIRVFSWGGQRQRYETAYVESGFCGYMPIRVSKAPGSNDPEFRFVALGKTGKEERVYHMRQTVVRRVREKPRR